MHECMHLDVMIKLVSARSLHFCSTLFTSACTMTMTCLLSALAVMSMCLLWAVVATFVFACLFISQGNHVLLELMVFMVAGLVALQTVFLV